MNLTDRVDRIVFWSTVFAIFMIGVAVVSIFEHYEYVTSGGEEGIFLGGLCIAIEFAILLLISAYAVPAAMQVAKRRRTPESLRALYVFLLLPIVFIVSALATGVAAVTFVMALLRGAGMLDADSDVVTKLEGMNSKILLFLLIALAVFVALGFRAPGMQLMVASGLGIMFWVGVVILGLLIPLFVGMGKKVRAVSTSVIVSLLVLVGGFCLRYVILLSGQLA